LLFPALLGSAILAVVCPLVGAHLILRRRIFLGLTLPQVAACGVAFTFWIYHEMGLAHGEGGERLLAMAGSLLWTLIAMGLLAYLDRHASGSPESRLAAAYALASALTILFVVFNPAGELEILNLLKGEVIALSNAELKLLATVYGAVFVALILFRREFLLSSFDSDLAFLLTGGKVQWSALLYLLCGLSIAVGVIMAGPLLVFGFMVLPPLAARPFARASASFFTLSSLIGLFTAIFGFYLSIILDLPLGPTDVALACALLFLSHALKRLLSSRSVTYAKLCVVCLCLSSCSSSQSPALPLSLVKVTSGATVWLPNVRNATRSELRMPGTNPLRSLGEMAGKIPSDNRVTAMDLLRESLKRELEERGVVVGYPERQDARLGAFPFSADGAAQAARTAKLSGYVLLAEIRRWDGETHGLLRTSVEFKLVTIEASATIWERRAQKIISSVGARLDQASADAAKEIARELFGS
jgi:ABC-type Mn2+/Zn2+ transport system permease subunit